MIDHRRLQRALFRMQADPAFAADVLAGSRDAVESTDLDAQDLALLTSVDPAALSADPGGKRRAQVLGNVASEFVLSLAAAASSTHESGLLDRFLTSAEFHAAVRADGPFPFAFASYARARLAELDDRPALAVLALEEHLARLRRDARSPAAPIALHPGFIVLAPTSRIVSLPRGTLDRCDALQAALESRSPLPEPEGLGAGEESALLSPVPNAERRSPHALVEVRAERLEPPADELLRLAERPLAPVERARYARHHQVEPEELEEFLAGFVAEGVLRRG